MATATDVETPKLESDMKTYTIEQILSFRYSLLSKQGEHCMRSFFDTVVLPDELPELLKSCLPNLKPHCTLEEWRSLQQYTAQPEKATSSNMDITFLYKILRNTDVMQKPTNDWGKPIDIISVTPADDIERIRLHRNAVAHEKFNEYTVEQLHQAIGDLCNAIKRLGKGKMDAEVQRIMNTAENDTWEMKIKCSLEKEASKVERVIVQIYQYIIEDLEKKETKEDVESVLKKLKIRMKKNEHCAGDIANSVKDKVLSWCDKHDDQKEEVIEILLNWTTDIFEEFYSVRLRVFQSSIVIHAQLQNLSEALRFRKCVPKKFESCMSLLFSRESFLTLFDPPLSEVKFTLSLGEMITNTDFSREDDDIRRKIFEFLSSREEDRNPEIHKLDLKQSKGEMEMEREESMRIEEETKMHEAMMLEREEQRRSELLKIALIAYDELKQFFTNTWKPERERVISELRTIRDNIQHDEQVHRAGSAVYSAAGMTGAGMVLTGIASAVLTGGLSLPLVFGGAAAATTSGIASTTHMMIKLKRTKENCLKAQNILQHHSNNSEKLFSLIKDFQIKTQAVIEAKGSYSFEEYVRITRLPSKYEGSIQKAIDILFLGADIDRLLHNLMFNSQSTIQDVLSMLRQLFNFLDLVDNLTKLTSGELSEHAQRIQQCIIQLEQELGECSRNFYR